MRILYFSSSGGSLPVLTALIDDPTLDVVGVVTKPDKQLGKKTIRNEIALFADEHGLYCLTPDTLKQNDALVRQIRELKPDIIVTAHYAFLIPQEILDIPHYALNLHFSLLPAYRGPLPLQWAIALGETVTGISIVHMTAQFDVGTLAYQQTHTLSATDTAAGLYVSFFQKAGELFPEVVKGVMAGTQEEIPQSEDAVRALGVQVTDFYARKLSKEDGRIDWSEADNVIERKIRAFAPWPGSWTTIREIANAASKARRTSKVPEPRDHGVANKPAAKAETKGLATSGVVETAMTATSAALRDKRVKILQAHREGEKMVIDQVQVEGKKAVRWEEFERGYLQ